MSDYDEKDFDKKFSEIMKLENIEDFDSLVGKEFVRSIKDYLLLLSTLNEFQQYVYTLLFSVLNEEEITLDPDAKESLMTIYKLATDFVDYMVELTEDDFVFISEDDLEDEIDIDDDDEEDEEY